MPPARNRAPRRSERIKKAVRKPGFKEEVTVTDIGEFVNALPRDKLEEMLVKLYNESVDASDLLRVEVEGSKERKKAEVWKHFRKTPLERLGNLGSLPVEVLVDILSYLDTQNFLTITGAVCKDLRAFKWIRCKWEDIDTREIPFSVLLGDIIPELNKLLPSVIKHANVAYKACDYPRCEKFLSILATQHTVKTLHLSQLTGVISPKRLEYLARLLKENAQFREVTDFAIFTDDYRYGNYREHSLRSTDQVFELLRYWPQLKSFALNFPMGLHGCINMRSFRLLSEAGSATRLDGVGNNLLTRIKINGGMAICSGVLPHLGKLFPELEYFQADDIHDAQPLEVSRQQCRNYDRFCSPLPRLKYFAVGFSCQTEPKHGKSISALFISLLKQAPKLRELEYTFYDRCDKPRLFSAIADWESPGGWSGVGNPCLRSLVLSNWALEWDLFHSASLSDGFPALMDVKATGCINVERDLLGLIKQSRKAH